MCSPLFFMTLFCLRDGNWSGTLRSAVKQVIPIMQDCPAVMNIAAAIRKDDGGSKKLIFSRGQILYQLLYYSREKVLSPEKLFDEQNNVLSVSDFRSLADQAAEQGGSAIYLCVDSSMTKSLITAADAGIPADSWCLPAEEYNNRKKSKSLRLYRYRPPAAAVEAQKKPEI